MSDERIQRAEEALNAVLKPLGTNLKHYMAVHRDAAVEAMAKLVDERHEELLDKVDGLSSDLDSAVEVAWNRGATDWVRLNYPRHYERFTCGG